MPREAFNELAVLISALCDGCLTPAQRDRLSAMVVQDETACQTYLDYMHAEAHFYRILRPSANWIDHLDPTWPRAHAPRQNSSVVPLDTDIAASHSLDDAWILPAIREEEEMSQEEQQVPAHQALERRPHSLSASPISWWRRLLTSGRAQLAAAAALLLVTSLTAWLLISGHRRSSAATLVSAVDATWEGAATPGAGSDFPGGPVTLVSGTAQIRSSAGATVIVEGPATFEIKTATSVSLRQGKIVVDVPHDIKGFTVQAPSATVEDLGTEFGVSVDSAGSCEVHVLVGQVAVSVPNDAARRQVVAEGSACRVDSGGHSEESVPFDSNRFAFAARPDGPSPYDRWAAYARQLRSDANLLGYYTFEKDASRPNLLINTASSHLASDGRIEKARWDQGRFPGKSSLAFSGLAQRVKLNVPGQFQSLTFWVWLRSQGPSQSYNGILAAISSDALVPGQFRHLSVLKDGWMNLSFRNASPIVKDRWNTWNSTRSVMDWNAHEWTLVACTIDNDIVYFYCNGAQAGEPQTLASSYDTGTMTLGEMLLGNFIEPQVDQSAAQYFRGSIDELGILARAMSGAEIQQLYAASKP